MIFLAPRLHCYPQKDHHMNSKDKKLIATTALATLLAGAATIAAIYVISKKRREKRLAVVSNAGYEMAYDVHFPMKYKKSS